MWWGILSGFIACSCSYTDFYRAASASRGLSALSWFCSATLLFFALNAACGFLLYLLAISAQGGWLDAILFHPKEPLIKAALVGILTPVILKSSTFYLGGNGIGLEVFYAGVRRWAVDHYFDYCQVRIRKASAKLLSRPETSPSFLDDLHHDITEHLSSKKDRHSQYRVELLALLQGLELAPKIVHFHAEQIDEANKAGIEAGENSQNAKVRQKLKKSLIELSMKYAHIKFVENVTDAAKVKMKPAR